MCTLKILKYKNKNLSLGGLVTVVGSDGKPTQVSTSSLGQLGGAIGGAASSSLGGAGIYLIKNFYLLQELSQDKSTFSCDKNFDKD